MKLIIDTNIIISALIRDSISRRIIVKSEWKFYYPEKAFHEIEEHKNLILKKSGMKETEYIQLLSYLLNHIIIVPENQVRNKLKEANNTMGKIDIDDVVFLATALSLQDSRIWSDDADFDKQNKVKVLKTKDVIRLFME